MSCLFCKILEGEIPADAVYQDDKVFAFRDINPQAPVHILVIPREHIPTTNDVEESHKELIGHMVTSAAKIAADEGLADDGYRLILNCNQDAGQTVFHLHLHIMGGRQMGRLG